MTTSAQAAAAIRKELKEKFPTIKFSVRSENFAGGDAVTVGYTNAVPEKEVEKVTRKYQYGHFDASQDLYEYSNNREDIPQAKWITVNRHISPEVREALKAEIAAKFGIKDITSEEEWRKTMNCWSDQAIWNEIKERSF